MCLFAIRFLIKNGFQNNEEYKPALNANVVLYKCFFFGNKFLKIYYAVFQHV